MVSEESRDADDGTDQSEASLSELEIAVLEALTRAFPVSWAPYCDLAETVGSTELDVLNAVLDLRESGIIGRIGADFDEGAVDALPLSDAEQSLAFLLEGDIPYGEHPFSEIAAMLQMQGVDVEESWVLERTQAWLADGVLRSLSAQPLDEDPDEAVE